MGWQYKKINYIGLPPINDFYSKLSQKGLSECDYNHAQNVYNTLNCKSFLDYHLTYLKTDVLLLADVFENFRKTCLEYYKLDPANYITSPSLAWDAMLLKTGIELEQISDYNIFKLVEEQKRGGLCFVGSQRYAKANNPYLDDYDKSKPTSYIPYWDMNNLYGCAMIDYLPYGGHEKVDIDIEDVLKTPDDSNIGYVVRVDIEFPEDTHEIFKQYTPAPENISPKKEWMTEYQQKLAEQHNIKITDNNKKLIPHLYKHEKYSIDYRNLK